MRIKTNQPTKYFVEPFFLLFIMISGFYWLRLFTYKENISYPHSAGSLEYLLVLGTFSVLYFLCFAFVLLYRKHLDENREAIRVLDILNWLFITFIPVVIYGIIWNIFRDTKEVYTHLILIYVGWIIIIIFCKICNYKLFKK